MPTRYSTRVSYQSFIDRYIRPRWAETPITGVKPMAVEDWLRRLKLAPKTRGHVKALMSVMFKCAQRWELITNNPMQLVRVKDVSKRQQRPSVLTAGEFYKLLPHLREPYRTMVLIAGCLGLRAGEIVGLQWGDFNFEKSYPDGSTRHRSRQSWRREDGVFTRCRANRPRAGPRATGLPEALLRDAGWVVVRQSRHGQTVSSGGDSEEAHQKSGESCGDHGRDRLEDLPAQLPVVAGPDRSTNRGAARIDAPCQHSNDDECVWTGNDGWHTAGTRQCGGDDIQACQ